MDALNYGHSLARVLVESGEPELAEELLRSIYERQARVLKTRPNHEHSNTLRSLTQGRASFSMHFEHYEAVPFGIAEDVVKKRREEGKIK